MSSDGIRLPGKFVKIGQSDVSADKHKVVTAERNISDIEGVFAIIESRKFLKECLRRSVQSAFTRPVETYSSVLEFEKTPPSFVSMVILSLSQSSTQAAIDALRVLSGLAPEVPIVVLSYEKDPQLARVAIEQGAKGYIPVTMGFEIAIEAIRFVLAGGSYVPVDFFLAPYSSESSLQRRSTPGIVTSREFEVVQAIQQGKPNKIIAAELNMCESTVKVHVRHIMKKLSAKNRTDVAIKSAAVMCLKCECYSECWATRRCVIRKSTITGSIPAPVSLSNGHQADISNRSMEDLRS